MASTGWPFNYRFCSLDMFSFSLNPEIVSFLWRSSQPTEFESTARYVHPTKLFHIILSPEEEEASVLSTVHRAVVTTGILVVVGLSSFCAYKLLQCVRQSLCKSIVQRIRNFLVKPFVVSWRKPEEKADPFDRLGTVRNNNFNGRSQCKRPADLQIVSSGSPIGNRLRQSSRETSLERRLLTKAKTPLVDCDVASGEEDISEIQGQYFGPTMKSSTFCTDLLGSSPEDTPTHDPGTRQRRRRDDNTFY